MPLYEYRCKKCRHGFEKLQQFSNKPLKKCPECGGPLEKLISASQVQFKGSGWYVTDYAKKSSAAHASSSESESGAKESKDAKETKDASETKETKDAKKDDKSKSDSSHKKHKKD